MLQTIAGERAGSGSRASLLALAILVGVALPAGAQVPDPKPTMPGLDDDQARLLQEQVTRLEQQLRQAAQDARNPNRLGAPLFQARQGNRGAGLNALAPEPNARLGARVARPVDALVDQLDLPTGQGLVIEDLTTNSPAARAGVKVNDILLELNGKPVSSNPEEFNRQLTDVKPDQAVDAVVLRKGRKETIKGLSLPEARAELTQPGRLPLANGNPLVGGGFQRNGSVSTTRVNDQFITRQQQGDDVVIVTGKVADGKPIVEGVFVRQGGTTNRYDSVDKVPEAQRATAQKLAELAVRGSTRGERNR